jgi:uncharacterized Zn finger protein|tara:strand:+ start:170 stop:349 length:180 start_codon:yes stop_codon:yes gene_type:complete
MARKVNIECKGCGKEVDVIQRPRFKRKYCDKCSKKNKEEWKDWKENQWKLTVDDCEDEE